jgi:hypothetical protein
MTIRIVRLLLWIAVAFVLIGTIAGLAMVAQSAFTGRAAPTTLPLRIEPAQASEVVERPSGSRAGELVFDRATLNVRAGGTAYAGMQALDIAFTGGLWLLILFSTLRLAAQFARAEHFDLKAVHRLRMIGWSMIVLNGWMWARMLVLPPLLLAAINPTAGAYRILPSIAKGMAGARNARVDATLGFGLLAAGLLILVLSEAFRAGTALREDNEAIV